MHQQVVFTAMLGIILSLAAVACGGGADEDVLSPSPSPSTTAAPSREQVQSGGTKDLQAEAQAKAIAMVIGPAGVTGHTDGATDFTLHLTEGVRLPTGAGNDGGGRSPGVLPFRLVPNELIFKVGESVNFTFKPQEKSRFRHVIRVKEIGIKQPVKYGKPATFTYTFDTAGTFRIFCETHVGAGMMGSITVQ